MQPSEKRKNIFLERESESLALFLNDYCGGRVDYKKMLEGKLSSADAYVPEKELLIEVKEIHDTEANQKSAQWGTLVNKIKEAIKEHPRYQSIKGLYSINTPQVFKIPPQDIKMVAEKILNAIETNESVLRVHNVEFSIERFEAESGNVVFSTHYGGAINPSGTIFQNISEKIKVADRQLGMPIDQSVKKRILLLSNKYHFAERLYEVMEAFGYAYEILGALQNIDEIWLQAKEAGKYKHTLIFDKKFYAQYKNKCLEASAINNELFGLCDPTPFLSRL